MFFRRYLPILNQNPKYNLHLQQLRGAGDPRRCEHRLLRRWPDISGLSSLCSSDDISFGFIQLFHTDQYNTSNRMVWNIFFEVSEIVFPVRVEKEFTKMLLKADAVSLCNGQKNNNDLNIIIRND